MKRFFCLLDLVIVCGSIISTIVTETETTSQNLCSSVTEEGTSCEQDPLVTQPELVKIENTSSENSTLYDLDSNLLDSSNSKGHVSSGSNSMWTGTLRLLRFLQIIRIVRIERGLGRGNSWKLLASVVRAHFRELMTSLYIGFIILLLGSYAVYQLEVETNSQFSNYGDALWWGIVSLTTIGYGRHVPETPSGRIVSSFFLIRKYTK